MWLGDGQQIAANLLYVQRNLACRLHRVGMEVHVSFRRNLANLAHRLQHARLIVRQDDADQLRLRTQRPPHIIGIDQRPPIHRQVRHRATHLFQALAGVQHGMVLDRRGDDVIARLHHPQQRQVVAFGAAAGEDDLRRTAVQQIGNLLAGALDRCPRLLPLLVNRRGVAKLLEEVRTHRLKHLGQKRSGSVVVEVNPSHGLSILAFHWIPCGREAIRKAAVRC